MSKLLLKLSSPEEAGTDPAIFAPTSPPSEDRKTVPPTQQQSLNVEVRTLPIGNLIRTRPTIPLVMFREIVQIKKRLYKVTDLILCTGKLFMLPSTPWKLPYLRPACLFLVATTGPIVIVTSRTKSKVVFKMVRMTA